MEPSRTRFATARGVAVEHVGEPRCDHEVRGALCEPLGVAQRLVLGDLPADEHGADRDHHEDERHSAEVGDQGAADPRIGPHVVSVSHRRPGR
jgi:hypothetical protein